jgi:hypothetical protein
MNNFIKQIIEEKFASKAQQRFFYAKANEKDASKKEKKKWGKWAKEFSSDTDFEKIPEKVGEDKNQLELQFDEIVDKRGNIRRSKKPTDLRSKGVSSNSITDRVVKTGGGTMGVHGVHGTHTSLRYWAEGEEITKEKLLEISLNGALGAEDTIMKPGGPADYDEAKKKMEKLVGDEDEAEDRLEKMGYDEKLPEDKVRLVENPKKFMEEYIESVLSKKNKDNDIVSKNNEKEIKELNPIVLKQITSLKNTMDSHGLSIDDVIKHLNKDNE